MKANRFRLRQSHMLTAERLLNKVNDTDPSDPNTRARYLVRSAMAFSLAGLSRLARWQWQHAAGCFEEAGLCNKAEYCRGRKAKISLYEFEEDADGEEDE